MVKYRLVSSLYDIIHSTYPLLNKSNTSKTNWKTYNIIINQGSVPTVVPFLMQLQSKRRPTNRRSASVNRKIAISKNPHFSDFNKHSKS